ncbi:MAG: IS91 family transposase [Myxococcales bacterium]|nr:IS91 family transposase [Myxococcales bacterium]
MSASPGSAGRTRYDLATIVVRHRDELEGRIRLSLAQRRVLSAIAACRTAVLGGHVDVCTGCGYEHPAYNSCRNRHCPKCQALRQERWIRARSERLLPVKHFHVVFTLPSELRALPKVHPRDVFGALFAAASSTLLELGGSRLEATLGITMVLHTWTRKLEFHPHVHALVTAGGFSADARRWASTSERYLFPVTAMQVVFRAKVLAALAALNREGAFVRYAPFEDPEAFGRLARQVASKTWVIYAKKPFRRVDHVLRYLGRYTHRVAIANSRLVAVSDVAVRFRTKQGKVLDLHPVEFLRRFLQHVLPDGFHKIRHFGLYAGASSKELELARGQLAQSATDGPASASVAVAAADGWIAELRDLTGRDVSRCPSCDRSLERRPVPNQQAPPSGGAA